MTISFGHENLGCFLGKLVLALTLELGLPLANAGSTTFVRRKMKRGLEPDQCFYIAHAPEVRGKTKIRLAIDPPPDLAIEIDVTSSSVDRMGIYAKLRVPEIWRWA